MGERWVTLLLVEDETLRCHSCYESIHRQEVHMYLDVNDSLDEIMCEVCWKKDQRETNK